MGGRNWYSCDRCGAEFDSYSAEQAYPPWLPPIALLETDDLEEDDDDY